MTTQKPLVAIRCITYNQAPYIRQCLDGFIMQRTDFPFVAIVHDDCSTDGTDAIVREYAERYPDIIKPIFETENQYSKRDGSLSKIMANACNETGAKYIALCEGDDYWTDPLKLQKQVTFLEEHPKCGLCYTRATVWDQDNNRERGVLGRNQDFLDLLYVDYIPTCTTIIRIDAFDSYVREIASKKTWQMGDYPLFLYLSYKYSIKYLDDITGVYREVISSASHYTDKSKQLQFYYSAHDCKIYFSKYLNNPKLEKKIYLHSISSLLTYTIINDLNLEGYIIKDIFEYKRYNIKVLTLCFFASSRPLRFAMRAKYKMSRFVYKFISKLIPNQHIGA